MSFSDLRLIEPILRAIGEEGYARPTPVQAQAIPHVLAGRDLLGIAQTGTGKTAAFALPILQRLAAGPAPAGRRPIRVLVVTPTRELATQIGESFATYGRHLPFRHAVIFGGVGERPQKDALARGVDVLVATPGRLLDLMGQGHVHLDRLGVFVLDEADRMLDMGFLPDVRRIIAALPRDRQTLFFSATMPPEAKALADRILRSPEHVAVTPPATTVETVTQCVYFVDKAGKQALLESLLGDPAITRALVFTRTKHGADRVVRRLHAAGVDAAAIHANKSQGQRERALGAFKAGRTRVLVATDIAARGLDVDDISHVVNFDLPNVPESYVHRIGRTARAGAAGSAISFCDPDERPFLRDIERQIRSRIPEGVGHETRETLRRPAERARRHPHVPPHRPASAPAAGTHEPIRHPQGTWARNRRPRRWR
jgi:ATP-dependent RNA helicase RhlE